MAHIELAEGLSGTVLFSCETFCVIADTEVGGYAVATQASEGAPWRWWATYPSLAMASSPDVGDEIRRVRRAA